MAKKKKEDKTQVLDERLIGYRRDIQPKAEAAARLVCKHLTYGKDNMLFKSGITMELLQAVAQYQYFSGMEDAYRFSQEAAEYIFTPKDAFSGEEEE